MQNTSDQDLHVACHHWAKITSFHLLQSNPSSCLKDLSLDRQITKLKIFSFAQEIPAGRSQIGHIPPQQKRDVTSVILGDRTEVRIFTNLQVPTHIKGCTTLRCNLSESMLSVSIARADCENKLIEIIFF